jgi:hypothetical protein
MCVGNGTASVVVEMRLNVASDNTPQSTNQVIHLTWSSTANGISDTNTVDANTVNSLVEGEQVDEVRSERVFGGESNFDSLTASS